MSSKPYLRRNFSLAWPLAFNAVLMQSMLMIDTLLVSPLGEESLAGMAIASTIIAFILGILMALANGSQLVISRAVGSGVAESISKSFWSGMIINVLAATFFWALLHFFEQSIISAFTSDIQLHKKIIEYLDISRYLVFFTAFSQVMISLFNGLGRTKIPLQGYMIELPVNAVVSYFLIHGFANFEGMGVKGAAIGSIIGIAVRLGHLILSLHYAVNFSLAISRNWQILRKNITLHFNEISPVAANMMMLAIGVTIYQLLYSQLDLNAYVAITLVAPWIKAGSQFITSWSQSSAIIISQAIGAKNLTGLNKNIDSSINVAVFISFLAAILFAIFNYFIADIYTQLDPATYQALAVIAPLYIFLPIVRGYNTVHGNVLRALGKTSAVFKINFTGQWAISLPLLAILIFYFDISLFWAFAVQPLEEIIKALPFRMLARKSMRELNEEQMKKLMYD